MSAIKEARLNLRLSASDDLLIRDAAAVVGTSVSDYVTEAAIERARRVPAGLRHFPLGEDLGPVSGGAGAAGKGE